MTPSPSVPAIGDRAPDFELAADDGTMFRLSHHLGTPIVLYFYPADDTEGCTTENIEFTAEMPGYATLGIRVVGISPDGIATHRRFRSKHGLKTVLLADPDRVAIRAYGLWQSKVTFGHRHDGVVRTTFLVAPDGTIAAVQKVTRIKGHAAAMLAEARRLLGSAGH